MLVNSYIVPFELASQYPATQQYIDLLNQYAGGAKPKSLGVNAMSAWLLWATAAKACGSNLTRDCVMATPRPPRTGPPAACTRRRTRATPPFPDRSASCS